MHNNLPPVLDVCCGSRSFWHNRQDERAIYIDKRVERFEYTHKNRTGIYELEIKPTVQADFTALPFSENLFYLVVFDPPHILNLGEHSYTRQRYGKLPKDWASMLRSGFSECFRVLRPYGTLVFKWNEYDIPVSEILKLTPISPLFGHRRGKEGKTHWITFTKPNNACSGLAPAGASESQVVSGARRNTW